MRNANALVAAAHSEFSTARNEFASARTAFAIAAQQKFAAAFRHEPTALQGKLASYVALIDDAVLDVRGPLAMLGGRLTPDIAPKSDRLMLASADPQARPQTLVAPPAPAVKQLAQSLSAASAEAERGSRAPSAPGTGQGTADRNRNGDKAGGARDRRGHRER